MRDKVSENTRGKMMETFYTLFYGITVWPRFTVLVIATCYIVLFTVFALSYLYIFAGTVSGYQLTENNHLNIATDTARSPAITPAVVPPLDTVVAGATVEGSKNVAPATYTSVRIDGKNIPISQDGTVHKVLSSVGDNSSVDVSVQSNGSTGSQTSSSVDVTLQTSSHTVDGAAQ